MKIKLMNLIDDWKLFFSPSNEDVKNLLFIYSVIDAEDFNEALSYALCFTAEKMGRYKKIVR